MIGGMVEVMEMWGIIKLSPFAQQRLIASLGSSSAAPASPMCHRNNTHLGSCLHSQLEAFIAPWD